MKRTFFAVSLFAVAFALHSASVNAQDKREKQERTVYQMTGEMTIDHAEDGHKYKVQLENSKIVELIVDGKRIPEQDYPKYEPMIRKLIEQAEKDRARAEKDRAEAEVHREEAARHREEAEEHRAQAQKDREQAEVHRKQAEVSRREAEIARGEAEKHRQRAEQDRARAAKDREHAEVDRAQAEKERAQAEIHRKQADEDRKFLQSMLDEVVTDKLADSRSALKSLILDNKEFYVNDVKQPDAVHAKFKAKYLKKEGSRIHYSNSGTYSRMSVDSKD